MAKINNTAAYATVAPTADSIVIGSTESDGDTKNFQMSDIATYVMSPSVSTITLQQVCDQGAVTTTGITVNGVVDANSTADIADTLTLSKATGNGLAVTASADIGGNLVVSGSLSAVDIATFFQNTTFNQGVILNDTAPTSPTDTGIAGEIAVDADYIYVCTATDTWKRVALAAWTP